MLLQIPKSIESQKTVIHHDIRHKKPILLYEVLAISLSLGSHLSTVIAIDGANRYCQYKPKNMGRSSTYIYSWL